MKLPNRHRLVTVKGRIGELYPGAIADYENIEQQLKGEGFQHRVGFDIETGHEATFFYASAALDAAIREYMG